MSHRLAPQARTDIDDIAYYTFVESGSLEIADRLIESIYSRFVLLGLIRARAAGAMIFVLACGRSLWASTSCCIELTATMS